MANGKILLIEDDKNLIANLHGFLEEEEFSLKTAEDGVRGIETAIKWQPDIIICDINIPGKDGYQVLSELSGNDSTKTIPFIFLTAKVEREDLRKGMQLGADDYIFKPFDLDDLLNSINLRLEKSRIRKKTETSEIADKQTVYDLDDKILVQKSKTMRFVKIKDIKFIRAENPYVNLKLRDGKNYLLRQTLTRWEVRLPSKLFIRIHRSTIINTEFITKIEKLATNSYLIRLKDEKEPFVISKRYSSKLRNRFI